MIRVKKIVIHEFRGIRDLTINFKENNFAICGKNGTGKSGIVDALEFALTGNISRLIGTGTGNISIRQHAPHVDSRDQPDKARVTLTLSIPGMQEDVTIERSVDKIDKPSISPRTPKVLDVLENIALHPEFTLSRRELIKYIISTPGNRSQQVQALLRLTKIESFRSQLNKITNASEKEVMPLKREKDEGQKNLALALEITEFNAKNILDAVNIRRELLGLSPINALTPSTSIKDGLATAAVESKISAIPKIQATADIKKLRLAIDKIESSETQFIVSNAKDQMESLSADAPALASLNKESFLKLASQYIDDNSCPVCDTSWELSDLANLINIKLKKFESVRLKRSSIEKDLALLLDDLSTLSTAIELIESYAKLLHPAVDYKVLTDFKLILQKNIRQITLFLPLPESILSLDSCTLISNGVKASIDAIDAAISKIPDPTKQDAAREYLIIGQERLELYRSISLRYKQADEKWLLAKKISESYEEVTSTFLNDIYTKVEKDFSEYYRFINQDDEGNFTAELIPTGAGLNFNVNFYGRGFFPPGAYHSEGHQDGMGICLYLALMKHLLGKDFTFAVLDDVLMSVDTGHRREVCKLLKEKFSKTQFILTTHDEVWLKLMNTVGLVPKAATLRFKKWDVDHGPNEWSDRDVWSEIYSYLENNDVRSAAFNLRNYLEYVSSEICHNLRAKVEFRGDAQFQLGDLLPSATFQLHKLLMEAKNAATSWGKTKEAEEIGARKDKLDATISQTEIERWQTNAAIHFNQWENLDVNDFTPVVASFHDLIDQFFCNQTGCNSILTIIPERGQRETLKCHCGSINLTFNKKKSLNETKDI